MITSDEIKTRLWSAANELRGSMDASRYKDYMLGLMFYKFLSDKTLHEFKKAMGMPDMDDAEALESYYQAFDELGEGVTNEIQQRLGYYVEPQYLYHSWLRDINRGDFEVQKVADSLSEFERSVAQSSGNDDFKGLFANSTLDLSDTALGSNLNERSKNIRALVLLFADLDMVALQDGDVLGDAYEYLIGQFAMESGKKAGEFYTPSQVSEVMARIVATQDQIESIYDPTVGSGSLLLTVGRLLPEDQQRRLNYYGQEKNTATYNLTRMNLILHGVRPSRMNIKNGDTLAHDWPEDPERPNEGVLFDAVVMNPPYSLKNWNKENLKVSDPRFEIAGVLPPNSKGDFAFLLHGLYHLNTDGIMAIVLPHGVLFRGGAEGEIRKRLLEKNYIDTIIGLPSNLFTNTGIPVSVIILKKNRELGEPVLFIDASNDFVKEGKQNVLQEKDIAKIVDTFKDRQSEAGYSHLAGRDEIIENDFNLNIPRYVESNTDEIPHDVDGHLYGGIPETNIKDLTTLNEVASEELYAGLDEIRPAYYELNQSIEDLTDHILKSDHIQQAMERLKNEVKAFSEKYWETLKSFSDLDQLNNLREDLLLDMKTLLESFNYVDTYNGYQLIAELWKETLNHDLELIGDGDFYELGRTREPNLVQKGSGSNRRTVQEGWNGRLVPNSLVEEELFQKENTQISDLQSDLDRVESELAELIESTLSEGSDEYEALNDLLKRNKEDEVQEAFDKTAVKKAEKETDSSDDSYTFIQQANDLLNQQTKLNRDIKKGKSDLDEAVAERILTLTDDEINQLMYQKWFGHLQEDLKDLVEAPIHEELKTLKLLHERYKDTIDDLDEDIAELEKEFEDLMSQLVEVE